MSSALLLSLVIVYFGVLLGVAWYTSRNADNDSFFIGNRNSNWMLVAFGMIGTSLSGVTFVSVPGTVGSNGFGYFQVVIGYFLGYFIVAYILLPLYYRMQLTSIYNYLYHRFGITAYKTGALFFIISRTLGATARLYLVINVLQIFILNSLGIPFWVTTLIILFMILMYTFKGGVKTIVFTDTLQTTFMLLGLIVCIIFIMQSLHLSLFSAIGELHQKGYTKTINTDAMSATFWLKQIIGGAFITVGMTGLDQEMMQKNISVRTLKDSQKNMMTFSTIMVFVNLLFLLLGGLLYLFAAQHHITTTGDDLFPAIALSANAISPYFPVFVSVIFIIGLISALFPSADGAITALTSSFCIDMIGIKRQKGLSETQQKNIRLAVHLSFTVLFFLCVLMFKQINSKSIINNIMSIAGYTYGPLLGLFSFGIFTNRKITSSVLTVVVCLVAPVICYFLSLHSADWFGGYKIGIELLIINGLLTFLGLYFISVKKVTVPAVVIFFNMITFFGCSNHNVKKPIQDSTEKITDTIAYTQHDIIYDSVEEKKILDTISSVEDVKEFAAYLDSATKGQRHMVIFVNKPDSTGQNQTDYSVQVGEDNGATFVTHYNFYVNPVTLSIRYYDIVSDSIISLKDWQRTLDKPQ